MLAIAGLDYGIVGLIEIEHPVHHGDSGEIALEVAFHGLRAEPRREADDFGAWGGHTASLLGDGVSDGGGGVDVGNQNAHGDFPINGCCGRRRWLHR